MSAQAISQGQLRISYVAGAQVDHGLSNFLALCNYCRMLTMSLCVITLAMLISDANYVISITN